VAGASEGLGAEFARQLAARGLNLLLIARRPAPLEKAAEELRATHGVEVRTGALDLASAELLSEIRALTDGIEVGMVVYNGAVSIIGPFLEQELSDMLRTIDVNCRGPVILAHELGRRMQDRGRGGIIIVSSLSAYQGVPLLSTYVASKAFDLVLGEGLWGELRASGVDVLAFAVGATRTPRYQASQPQKDPVSVMEVGPVVSQAFAALGRGPSAIPGRINRIASFVMRRLFPRRYAVQLMGSQLRSLYGQ
jgi:short-subunit dehydrogenase